ncbi:MAG: DUF4175 family protein, partial [Pirellulaceae bacterium]
MARQVMWARGACRLSSPFVRRSMNHPLEQQVAAVARRAKRLQIVYGAARVVACLVAAILLVGLADYMFRWEDAVTRWLASAFVVAAGVWATWRFLAPPLMNRFTAIQIAQRIEARFPQLSDRLSSTLAFLNQADDDATAGSFELRRAVVAETQSLTEQLDFYRCLDARRPRRAMLLALATLLLAAIAVGIDFQSAGLAARRLATPWTDAPWPRWNHLAIVDAPDRIAAGQAFEARVVDENDHLPDEVRFEYRWADDSDSSPATRLLKPIGDAATVRLDNVTRAIEYRAEGGDDSSMAWRTLEVVEPPAIESFEAMVQPPEYTGLAARPVGQRVRAIAGSALSLAARVNKPLKSVRLRFDGQSPTSQVNFAIDRDGRGFHVEAADADRWRVERDGVFFFELTDAEGIVGESEERWYVEAVADQPPTVSLDQPVDHVQATAAATVPLRVLVKDDLAVRRVTLRLHRSVAAEGEFETIPLYDAGESPPESADGGERGESRVIEHELELSKLSGLSPGAWLEL